MMTYEQGITLGEASKRLQKLIADKMAELASDPDVISVRRDPEDPTAIIVERRIPDVITSLHISATIKREPEAQ